MSRVVEERNPEIETLEVHESGQWRLALYKYDESTYSGKQEYIMLQHLCTETAYSWVQPEYVKVGCNKCGPPPKEMLQKYLLLDDEYEEDSYFEEPRIILPNEARKLEEFDQNRKFLDALPKEPTIVGLSSSTYPIHPAPQPQAPGWMVKDAVLLDDVLMFAPIGPLGGTTIPNPHGLHLSNILSNLKTKPWSSIKKKKIVLK